MEEEVEEGLPAWMGTFADLMSLLLCFFVLLLSFASVDIMKFEGMIGSMREAFGVKTSNPGERMGFTDSIVTLFDKEQISNDIISAREREILGEIKALASKFQVSGSVEIMSGKGGFTVRLEGDLLFSPGKVNVSPAAFAFLDEMSAVVRQLPHNISVEGHTDSSATGRHYRSNLELGAGRALSAARYVVAVGGIAPERVSVVSYGDTRPVAKNNSKAGRAKNRRVEFVFHRVPKPTPGR